MMCERITQEFAVVFILHLEGVESHNSRIDLVTALKRPALDGRFS
jgi:hypothetical protein